MGLIKEDITQILTAIGCVIGIFYYFYLMAKYFNLTQRRKK
tara:strand:+ start:294 stop:416 length:123 start_codon:yes stop_codon:yes gene_type:complete